MKFPRSEKTPRFVSPVFLKSCGSVRPQSRWMLKGLLSNVFVFFFTKNNKWYAMSWDSASAIFLWRWRKDVFFHLKIGQYIHYMTCMWCASLLFFAIYKNMYMIALHMYIIYHNITSPSFPTILFIQMLQVHKSISPILLR